MREIMRKPHPHAWLLEPIESSPGFVNKHMFSGRAIYLHGRMVLLLMAHAAPWDGLLIPMERENHAWLMQQRPSLQPHPVLGKWLYLSEDADTFESDAKWIILQIGKLEPKIGIVPKVKKKRQRTPFSKK